MLPRQLGFRVPEEDEGEDHESSSEQSREGSVEVIESRPRTFSIPSTDDETDSEEDDEIEIASSVQGDGNKDSTLTTPDHRASVKKCNFPEIGAEAPGSGSAQGGKRGLNLKGPSLQDLLSKPTTLDSSQQDPINLEGAPAERHDIPDIESEDDGPEILPIYQPQRSLAQSPQYLPNSRKPRSTSPLLMSAESPQYRPDSAEPRATTPKLTSATSPQFIPYSPEMRPTSFQLDSTQSPQIRPDSPEARPTSPQLHSAPSPRFHNEPQLAHSHYQPPTVDIAETDLDTEDQLKRIILETQARISKEKEPLKPTSPHLGAASQESKEKEAVRPTSPDFPVSSIAGATDGFDSEDDDGFDQDDDFSDIDPEEDIDSNESFPRVKISRLRSTYPNAIPPHVNMRSVMVGGAQPTPKAPATYNQLPCHNYGHNISMSEGIDVSQPSHNDPLPSVLREPSPSDAALAKTNWNYGNLGYDYTAPFSCPDLMISEPSPKPYDEGPFSGRNMLQQHDQSSWAWGGGASLRTFEPPKTTYGTQNPPTETLHGIGLNPDPRKASDRHSSKLNISSIVNAPFEETSQPRKRKADEMSSDNESFHQRASRQPPPPSPYSADAENTETPLPDAQARDILPPNEVASFTQESVPEPVIGLTSTTITTKVESTEGPARKKARISKSSTGGIVKFVSGVCVGLVGALTAFMATIPASVREEALRELSNGT